MPRVVKQAKGLAAGQPEKPRNLSPDAASEWDRISRELDAAHIQLTPAHRSILELAANIATDIRECRATVKKEGAYVQSKTGLVAHPAVRRLDALGRDYVKVAAMLGLRCAVPGAPPSKEKSLEDLLDE